MDNCFFVTTYGKRFTRRSFEYNFQLIRQCLLKNGQTRWKRRAPRLLIYVILLLAEPYNVGWKKEKTSIIKYISYLPIWDMSSQKIHTGISLQHLNLWQFLVGC